MDGRTNWVTMIAAVTGLAIALATPAAAADAIPGSEWSAVVKQSIKAEHVGSKVQTMADLYFGPNVSRSLLANEFMLRTDHGMTIHGTYTCDARGKIVLNCSTSDLEQEIAEITKGILEDELDAAWLPVSVSDISQKVQAKAKNGVLKGKIGVTCRVQVVGLTVNGKPYDSKGTLVLNFTSVK